MRNGAALRTCHRTSSSRSRARCRHFLEPQQRDFGDAVGNGERHALRARADALEHAPQRGGHRFRVGDVRRVQRRRRPRLRGSGSMACAVTESAASRDAMVAADTRCRAISTATVGGAGERNELFNKGDLVDLAKRRGALQHLLDGRFAQESHALFVGGFLDL